VLLWGDVRFGNVIFGDDLAPLAVLDWDMSSIGAPEHDVAWFTSIEDTTRTLLGQGIEGFPDCAGIVAQYESLSGRTLHDLAWYEILARVRSTAILARIGYLHEAAGQPNPMPVEGSPLLDLLTAKIAEYEQA
jgi:aminoglycoside phosphotransferase (APT) family kinase protein